MPETELVVTVHFYVKITSSEKHIWRYKLINIDGYESLDMKEDDNYEEESEE